MARSWFACDLALSMCVAQTITQRAKTFNYGGAASKNLLEYLLRVLRRSEAQCFGC